MQENAEIGGERKTCERCGEQFGCGANLADCWCSTVDLSEAAAGELRSNFNDCLCPACLSQTVGDPSGPG